MSDSVENCIKIEYNIGDKVVYPGQGVGVVVDTVDRLIAGHSGQYFKVEIESSGVSLYVPIRHAHSKLRPVLQTEQIRCMLNSPQRAIKIRKGDSWLMRSQEYEDKLCSGNVSSVIDIVCELNKKNKAKRSYSERKLYDRAINLLASEWMAGSDQQVDRLSVIKEIEGLLV